MNNKRFRSVSMKSLTSVKGAAITAAVSTTTMNTSPSAGSYTAVVSDTLINLTNDPAGEFAVRIGPPPPPGPKVGMTY
jgi:hypothetical protein